MMVEDFTESGYETRKVQPFPRTWESLTLENLVTFASVTKGTDKELYWLDRLEKFFLSV